MAGVAAMALLAPAASARQMTVKDEPTVSGPLEPDPELRACKTTRERSGGEVVAVFKICLQWYRFAPADETDPDKNYGALWIQATVDAKNGWCTRQMKVETVLPKKGTLTKAPRPGKTVRVAGGTKKVTSKLTVDAGGATETPGEIKQSYLVRKGTLRARFKSDANLYRLKWDGNSPKLLAMAKGIELEWPSTGSPPITTSAVRGNFRKTGGC